MGVVPRFNGKISRNLISATENLADHLTHFCLFFMPDFARPAYAARPWHGAVVQRFTVVKGDAAADVLPARAGFLRMMGSSLAIQPGGRTRAITAGERIRLLALLREFRGFLEKRLFGDLLAAVDQLAGKDQLLAWADGRPGDFPGFLHAASDLRLDKLGRAYDLFPAGTWQAAQATAFDPAASSATRSSPRPPGTSRHATARAYPDRLNRRWSACMPERTRRRPCSTSCDHLIRAWSARCISCHSIAWRTSGKVPKTRRGNPPKEQHERSSDNTVQ